MYVQPKQTGFLQFILGLQPNNFCSFSLSVWVTWECDEASSDTPNYKLLYHCSHWSVLEAGILDETPLTEPWWAELMKTACQEWRGRRRSKPWLVAGPDKGRSWCQGPAERTAMGAARCVSIWQTGSGTGKGTAWDTLGWAKLPEHTAAAALGVAPSSLTCSSTGRLPLCCASPRAVALSSPKPLSKLVSLSALFLTFTCLTRSKFSWEIFEKQRWSLLAHGLGVPWILAGALKCCKPKGRRSLFL